MKELNDIFSVATAAIPKEYFQLPIDGKENPIYRERVYCYELYHQMRSNWPPTSKYSLCGEVDKSGHPLIRDNGLNNTKPDFLIHTPGDMNGNYAVIEVKPVNARSDGLVKDVETLCLFIRYAQYKRGIYLIYGGENAQRVWNILSHKMSMLGAANCHLESIEFWWHTKPGTCAIRINV